MRQSRYLTLHLLPLTTSLFTETIIQFNQKPHSLVHSMDNRSYVFQQSHICSVALICAFLSLFLLYFNNGVFDGKFTLSNESRVSKNPKIDQCDGRYVYVYDLPSRFNEDMITDCKRNQKWLNMCKYTMYGGFGKPMNNTEGVFSDHGWYDTNQFTVSIIFYNRMKRYKCVTDDASLASAFYVPYYAGYDFGRYISGYNVSTRDATSIELVEWLQRRDEWKINNGKDHFVVAGRITWDFRRKTDEDSDWGNKFLLLPAARNMSVLLIESSPSGLNDFAIPYPTYFHPSQDSEVFDWQGRMRKTERKWLFCFAGGPRPGDPNSIRSLVIEQCKNSSVGKLLECGVDEKKCHSPSNVMKMFQSSVFCLQPEGDSYTRRSAFDSILAGCIPVFFHPGSFYTQYTWHVPKNHTKYSVFIPHDDIRKNVSIEQWLGQIDPNTVKMMREEVINMIPRLIYADPDSQLETLEDAFDISLKAIIHKVSKLRRDMIDGRTNDELVEEYGWKYALLEQGDEAAVREWEPYFPKPKMNNDSADGLVNKQETQT